MRIRTSTAAALWRWCTTASSRTISRSSVASWKPVTCSAPRRTPRSSPTCWRAISPGAVICSGPCGRACGCCGARMPSGSLRRPIPIGCWWPSTGPAAWWSASERTARTWPPTSRRSCPTPETCLSWPMGTWRWCGGGGAGGEVTTVEGERVDRPFSHITWNAADAQKGGYPHFMLKEIHEQPQAVGDTFGPRLTKRGDSVVMPDLGLTREQIRALRRVVMVACGTSYNTGLAGRFMLEEMAGLPAEVDISSEFRYRSLVLGPDTLVVA